MDTFPHYCPLVLWGIRRLPGDYFVVSLDIFFDNQSSHYSDVIMSTIASLITSLAVVYSTVYSDADQRKHQSSASLAFAWGIHRDRWIPRTKGQLRGKCFHLMTSSCGEWNATPWRWRDVTIGIICIDTDICPCDIEVPSVRKML